MLTRLATGAAAAMLLLSLSACNTNDTGNNTLAGRETENPTPTGGPQSTGVASGGSSHDVTVDAKDNEFQPKDLTASAGDITVTLKNVGAAPHTFTAKDLKADKSANAGQTVTIDLKDVKPGTYKYICMYHESLGMTGTLTVT
jgi:plastocyanin